LHACSPPPPCIRLVMYVSCTFVPHAWSPYHLEIQQLGVSRDSVVASLPDIHLVRSQELCHIMACIYHVQCSIFLTFKMPSAILTMH